MASELRVNTLKDASGNNSVATSTVAEGSAKGWANYSCAGTTFRDSFNFASATDQGTGDYDLAFTTSMSNDDYAVSGIANGSGFSNTKINLDGVLATGVVLIRLHNTADNRQDSDHCLVIVHGDRA